MLGKSDSVHLANNSFSDLKHEAEKRNLKLPPHPTKKQLIKILSTNKSPINDTNYQLSSSENYSSVSPFKEKPTVKRKKYHNANKNIKKIPDVVVIPPEQIKVPQNQIIPIRERSPLLPNYNNGNRNNSRQVATNQSLIDKKIQYSKSIYMILLITLCALVLINPYFFILTILCILGMIFSDSIAKFIILIEGIIRFFKGDNKI